jgi:N-acetylneuraminate lyase
MIKKEYLQGLIAAPFTPMFKNGSVNISVIPAYYEMLKANGVTGAFICGSTGEGASLTTNEKKAVAEAWASCTASDDGFKVMTFLGGTSIAECQDLAKHANEIGLYAVSFTSPYYFKPANVNILAKACIEIAETVPDMPFYYYHIPALNGANFKMIELIKILDGKLPNFFGIKYTHEDFMDFLSCLNFGNGKYNMLWGRDENMLSALILGAKGSVGSTFNYAAPLYSQLMRAFDLGDFANARKLQQQSIDMISLLGKYGGMGTGKAYMKLIGLDCGEFRLPIKNMTPEQFELFKSDSEEINFKTFASSISSVASS